MSQNHLENRPGLFSNTQSLITEDLNEIKLYTLPTKATDTSHPAARASSWVQKRIDSHLYLPTALLRSQSKKLWSATSKEIERVPNPDPQSKSPTTIGGENAIPTSASRKEFGDPSESKAITQIGSAVPVSEIGRFAKILIEAELPCFGALAKYTFQPPTWFPDSPSTGTRLPPQFWKR